MIKKILFLLVVALSTAFGAKAQMYAPCYAYYQGIGYFNMPNGYYYGWINCGFPNGEGYCYCFDPQLGPIFFHGYFSAGVAHGPGELLSNAGYICGVWQYGNFVSQQYVAPQQMQQSYTNAWNNYSTNYQASNNVTIPANTTITQIDSDTQLGRQLLGKIGQ